MLLILLIILYLFDFNGIFLCRIITMARGIASLGSGFILADPGQNRGAFTLAVEIVQCRGGTGI